MIKIYLLLFNLLILVTQSFSLGSTQPLGSGTKDDPYQISSFDNLIWVSENPSSWSKYFVQTANIDADSSRYLNLDSTGVYLGFSPIGNTTTNFTGYYNGKGHVIRNLYINRPQESNIGFIGTIHSTGDGNAIYIDSIYVVNANITGYNSVGIIFGKGYHLVPKDCIATGVVKGNNDVGGLVGVLTGNGFLNISKINRCNTSVEVYATGDNAGGMVGRIAVGNVVTLSASTGKVVGTNNVGGLVGKCELKLNGINNSYSTADVFGTSNIGKLVGYYDKPKVTNCYGTGKPNTIPLIDKVNIANIYYMKITDCFYLRDEYEIPTNIGTGLYFDEMILKSSFTNWDFDSLQIWKIKDSISFPGLSDINNPPFSIEDTLVVSGQGVTFAKLLENDFDVEKDNDELVAKIVSTTGGFINGNKIYFNSNAKNGDTIIVVYKAGEILKTGIDTLCGNTVTSYLIYNNSDPVLINEITTQEDVAKSVEFVSDADNDPISSQILNGPYNGTVKISSNTLTYTPTKDFFGEDSIEVMVTDGVKMISGWIIIHVSSINDVPEFVINELSTKINTKISSYLAYDPEHFILSYTISHEPKHGVVTIENDTIFYTPDSNYTGKDSVYVSASDGMLSTQQWIHIEVNDYTNTILKPYSLPGYNVVVAPTPVVNNANIIVFSSKNGMGELTLYNNMGVKLSNKKLNRVNIGKNIYKIEEISNLPKGIYYIEFKLDNNSKAIQIVIKN